MKHTFYITVIMVLIFFLSQVIGLYALSASTNVAQTPEGGIIVEYQNTAIGERPDIHGIETFVYMLVSILIGTGLILLLAKFRKERIWKAMFFFAVWMTCSITIGVFVDPLLPLSPLEYLVFSVIVSVVALTMLVKSGHNKTGSALFFIASVLILLFYGLYLSPSVSLILCHILAFYKVYKPDMRVHNVTELLIYPGIAVIFVPLLDIVWATLLLIAISAYDMFAVWHSKHMVSLAKFQTGSRAFAGVMLSYRAKDAGRAGMTAKSGKSKGKTDAKASPKGGREYRNAILGGGDIAFPLIFAGVAMESMVETGIAKVVALLYGMIIPLTVAFTLFALLSLAKKDRFYPAMPFLTAGCLMGYGILWLLGYGGFVV